MKKWYAASIILYTKFKDGNQDKYPIWENVVLISASPGEEAYKKAEKIGREDAEDTDDNYLYEGRPATWVFAGIRKIIDCVDPENRPGDGTEITYSEFQVDCEEDLLKLAKGEEVTVRYEE